MNVMYMNTFSRFGPMALGACMAFLLPNCTEADNRAEATTGTATNTHPSLAAKVLAQCCYWMAVALILFIITSSPPKDAHQLPDMVHVITTVATRNMFAVAVAVVLYGALSPETSPFHSPRVASALSWPGFEAVAPCTYCLNMFQVRYLFEIVVALNLMLPGAPKELGWGFVWMVFGLSFPSLCVLAHLFQRHFETRASRSLRILLGIHSTQDQPKDKAG